MTIQGERSLGQRLAFAIAIAVGSSAVVVGLLSLAGVPVSPGPVFGVVFAVVFLFGGGLQAASGAVRGAAREKIAARFPEGDYLRASEMANNFGVTSKGVTQARGNGALVLTHDALHFLALAGADLSIPRSSIHASSIVSSHLGKSVGRALLKVEYDNDSVAFFVEEPEAWREALASLEASTSVNTTST